MGLIPFRLEVLIPTLVSTRTSLLIEKFNQAACQAVLFNNKTSEGQLLTFFPESSFCMSLLEISSALPLFFVYATRLIKILLLLPKLWTFPNYKN